MVAPCMLLLEGGMFELSVGAEERNHTVSRRYL